MDRGDLSHVRHGPAGHHAGGRSGYPGGGPEPYGLEERPSIKELRVIAERWAPYRTAAAIMLWQFYRKMPLMEQAAD